VEIYLRVKGGTTREKKVGEAPISWEEGEKRARKKRKKRKDRTTFSGYKTTL